MIVDFLFAVTVSTMFMENLLSMIVHIILLPCWFVFEPLNGLNVVKFLVCFKF
jgi:hypothetical protein